MKRQQIRNYIEKIILETFYVDPSGNAMSAEEVEANEPGFMGRKYAYNGYPLPDDKSKWPSWVKPDQVQTIKDAPGEIIPMPNMRKVKEALGFLDEEMKEKISQLIFSDATSISGLTGNFDNDLELLKNAELNSVYKSQAESMLDTFDMIDLYRYIIYLKNYSATRDAGRSFNLSGQGLVADFSGNHDYDEESNSFPFLTLFRSVDPGKIGMGKSLMDKLLDIVEQSLENLNNESPDEFHDKVFPKIKSIVNSAFEKMPHILANMSDDLVRAKDAYLEAISFVLRELIGELNFETVYYGGSNELMFIPSDKSLITNAIKKEEDRRKQVNDRRVKAGFKPYVWDEVDLEHITSDLRGDFDDRSKINYYTTKYSRNPLHISTTDVGNMFDIRLSTNFVLGHGIRKFGFDLDWGDSEEISNRWQQS